jgi:hypothetical protein
MTNLEYCRNKNRIKTVRYEYDDPWEENQEFQLWCLNKGFRKAYNTPLDTFAPEIKEFSDLEKCQCIPIYSEVQTSNEKGRNRIHDLEKLPAGARVAELERALEAVSALMTVAKADLFLPRTKQWTLNELQKS